MAVCMQIKHHVRVHPKHLLLLGWLDKILSYFLLDSILT